MLNIMGQLRDLIKPRGKHTKRALGHKGISSHRLAFTGGLGLVGDLAYYHI